MVAHSALTGSELHEPKGVAAATDGFVARAASGAVSWGTIANSNVAVGVPVQMTNTISIATTSGSTTFPTDNTIPQITEGTLMLSHSHTPLSTTNKLHIRVNLVLGIGGSGQVDCGIALFDGNVNALAAVANAQANGHPIILSLDHVMTAGVVSAIAFTVRAGADSSTVKMNSEDSSTRIFGGVCTSSITVTEYKAS
jgi:hypothetical protein